MKHDDAYAVKENLLRLMTYSLETD